MKRWLIGLWCGVALAATWPVLAAPTAEDILKEMLTTYRSMVFFEETAVEKIVVTRGDQTQTMEVTHRFVYQAPNRFYYDSAVQGKTQQRAASNGAVLIAHQTNPRGDRYQRAEAPQSLVGSGRLLSKLGIATQFDPFAFLAGNDPLSAGMTAKLVGEETFEGKPVYVLEVSDRQGQSYTLRIGRDNHLLCQFSYQVSRTVQEQTVTQQITETHRDFRVNRAVDEATFAIQIPEGARVEDVVDLVGKPAPPIQLKDLDGNLLDLASLQGKTVLLNFWAHW